MLDYCGKLSYVSPALIVYSHTVPKSMLDCQDEHPQHPPRTPEPDYLIMKPAGPMESHKVKRNKEIENCFKCGHTNYMFGGHGASFYDNEFVRVSRSLAASPKPGYHQRTKEAIQ